MLQPGKVANPARGQLNREITIPLSAFAPENLVSLDGFGSPVSRQSAHLHTQAECGGVHLFISTPTRHRVSPEFTGSRIAYRWGSLPRVRWHRASKPQGSSERVQLNRALLLYTSSSSQNSKNCVTDHDKHLCTSTHLKKKTVLQQP